VAASAVGAPVASFFAVVVVLTLTPSSPGASVLGFIKLRAEIDLSKGRIESCYFDHYQGTEATEPPAFPGSFTPLSEVYALQPMPPGLNAQQATHVLGAQGNFWSEYVPTPAHAEYMAFPRAIALAEVIWSDPGALDYAKFVRRLEAHSAHLDALDTNYAPHFRDDL
jgi:hexosaminidase